MFGFFKRRRDSDSGGAPEGFAPTEPLRRPAEPEADPVQSLVVAETGWEDWEQSLQLQQRATGDDAGGREPAV